MIYRSLLSTLLAATVVLFVGAQNPKSLPAQQKSELYKKNRSVIEKLIEQTIESSRTPNDRLKQADSYYDVLLKFSAEITEAKNAKDEQRVDELTRHLETLLDTGLAPTLDEAKKQVDQGTHAEKYKEIKVHLLTQLDALRTVLQEGSPAKTALDKASERLKKIQ